jgi:uncharacterized protein
VADGAGGPEAGRRQAGAAPGLAHAVEARNLTRGTLLGTALGVAESFGGRFMGLMGRPSLPPGGGLWLRPGSSIHMLFMRFPIDAVFLAKPGADGTRRVVAVHEGLRPWTGVVWWARGADGCLELESGAATASGTVAGDRVRLEGIDPPA